MHLSGSNYTLRWCSENVLGGLHLAHLPVQNIPKKMCSLFVPYLPLVDMRLHLRMTEDTNYNTVERYKS